MGRPKKTKPTQETAAEPTVTITVRLADKTFVGEGATTLAALQAIEKPDHIKSKGFVTITCGSQKTERFFRPQQMNRLFYSSPSLQAIQAKMLCYGLKNIAFA